ncbi:hypothetical protein [Gillisia sp. CAL575]|uniref:hypothetical protein n=1 Tax=Gillisia sp. CAL575 TaxID=985255 RepID=UPI0003A57A90|nr:hypothetical protein [Gillisia sp. CAL575]
MKEILTNLIIGILGGFLGGILVYFYQKRTEKSERKNQLKNQIDSEKKILPNDFLNYIDIGMNINKINELIGLPTYSFEIDDRDMITDGLKTNLNSYYFENCSLKITHDNNQVTSYILQSFPDSNIEFEMPDSDFDKTILGKFAVDSNFEEIKEIIYESNYRESWFGIVMYFGRRGNYYDYCYYGDLANYNKLYDELEVKDFIGHLITAYGVSSDSRLFRYHSYY